MTNYSYLDGEPQDIFVGRVYSYDSTFKLLILSKYPTKPRFILIFHTETVINPGTPDEAFADSIMINARNIKHMEPYETEPVATESLNGTELSAEVAQIVKISRVGSSQMTQE